MNDFVLYSVFTIAQLIFFYSIYLLYTYLTAKKQTSYTAISSNEEPLKDMDMSTSILLNKSLKHLEFISNFEIYLERATHKNFSIEFLQEFEKIKSHAQKITLKTVNELVQYG